MMSIVQDLAAFYDAQADKFSHTRKKPWPEISLILEQIESHPKQKVAIVELGCGDGRLYRFLQEHCSKEIIYTGIDISEKLLAIAQSMSPNANWQCQNMEEAVMNFDQESVDFFISVASFQHLPTKKKRLVTLSGINRALRYGGKHVSINWAYSRWFKQKMKKAIGKAWRKWLVTLGRSDKRDILVPWTKDDQSKTYHRYYHLFSLQELQSLSKHSGFIIKKLDFIQKDGSSSQSPEQARNSFLVQEKNISGGDMYQR